MKPYSCILSIRLLIGFFGLLAAFVFLGSRAVASYVGSSAATITDLRFLTIGLLVSLLIFRFNPLVLGVFLGFIYTAFLHLTLQGHWASLGLTPSFTEGLMKDLVVGIVFMSLVHVVATKVFGSVSGRHK